MKERTEFSLEKERAVVVVPAAAAAAAPEAVTAAVTTATEAAEADDVEVKERDGRTDDSGALFVESVGELVLEEGWQSFMDMRAIERCGEVREGGSSLYRCCGWY